MNIWDRGKSRRFVQTGDRDKGLVITGRYVGYKSSPMCVLVSNKALKHPETAFPKSTDINEVLALL